MNQALEDLARDFEHWRHTRTGTRNTPQHLSARVSELLEVIPKATLAKKLKVNYDYLNRIIQSKNQRPICEENDIADQSIKFASFDLNATDNNTVTATEGGCVAHFNLPNGIHFNLNGNPTQLADFVKSLNQGGSIV